MNRKSTVEPSDSPIPGVIPGTTRVNGEPPMRAGTQPAAESAADSESRQPARPVEARGARFRRKAHRTRLHGYAIVGVALVAYLIALAASNTGKVRVDWVFGSSQVALVWLVLFTAILGWLLGILTTVAFRWRTRAPRS